VLNRGKGGVLSGVDQPTGKREGQRQSARARLRAAAGSREAGLLLTTAIVSAALALLVPDAFLSSKNLVSVLTGTIYDLPLAAGMTLVLILGGIDLSVGAVLGLCGVVIAMLLRAGAGVPISILLGLLLGGAAGAVNGICVARFRIAPFIATLGMMSIARGTTTVLTSGYFLSGLPRQYQRIGQGTLLGIPYPVYVVVALLLAMDYGLRNWRPLNDAFYAGANPDAAELSGIPVRKLVFAGFVASGLLAALAGIFMTSRLAMGYARFGEGAELKAIAAAVIGGASLSGGSGSISGMFLGVLLLAVVNNGFVLLNGSVYWQAVVSGAILVVAIAVDAYRRRKEERE